MVGKDINMKGQKEAPGRNPRTPSSTWSSGIQAPESREQVWNLRQPVIPDQPQRDAPWSLPLLHVWLRRCLSLIPPFWADAEQAACSLSSLEIEIPSVPPSSRETDSCSLGHGGDTQKIACSQGSASPPSWSQRLEPLSGLIRGAECPCFHS